MLKERRELNLAFLAEHAAENRTIEDQYHCSLWLNQSLEDEQIANYILDLEVKVKTVLLLILSGQCRLFFTDFSQTNHVRNSKLQGLYF